MLVDNIQIMIGNKSRLGFRQVISKQPLGVAVAVIEPNISVFYGLAVSKKQINALGKSVAGIILFSVFFVFSFLVIF